MDEEDRKRFARYYPGYVEPPEESQSSDEDKITNPDDNKDEKLIKTKLGYIKAISVDKESLIKNVINKKQK